MKEQTVSFIIERISSSIEEIAPILSGIKKEDWQKFLQITMLVEILRKELTD